MCGVLWAQNDVLRGVYLVVLKNCLNSKQSINTKLLNNIKVFIFDRT